MTATWLLLLYSVPAEPSRKRAFVWRELKKAGAIALRDGVWALPERDDTALLFQRIAAKAEELGGEATIVEGARIAVARAAAIRDQSCQARAAEYREVARETERFLAHVRRESEHREFTFAELEELEHDLAAVQRWSEQVRARDYFGAEGGEDVRERLARCEDVLASFLDDAFRHEEARQ